MTPFRYRVAGSTVQSALPLYGLFPTDENVAAEYEISRMVRVLHDVRPRWPAERNEPRHVIRKCEGDPVSYWIRTGDDRSHRICPGERRMEFDADSPAGLALTHGIVDFALPNLLSCGDQAVFHGALLETRTGCVAALGEAGVGKSTLTARWVRAGHRFLSDDWFVLRSDGGRLLASPSHPSIRLRSRDRDLPRRGGVEEVDASAMFSKVWYSFAPGSAAFCPEPRDLRGVAFLHRAGNGAGRTGAVPTRSRDAVTGLMSSMFLLEIDSAPRWEFLLPLMALMESRLRIEDVYLREGMEDPEDGVKAVERLGYRATDERTSSGDGVGKGADARGR